MSKPKNWPISLPYLKAPLHGKDISPSQTQFLRTQPLHLPTVPASSPATETPCPHVKIQAIQDPLHPACGQRGLFATRNIAPGGINTGVSRTIARPGDDERRERLRLVA
ncbi:uncharacterized protein TrAtP1_008577 [Trichoderma atroviride]|uniref:uncharacterized protein n=1 Tax=Hypocrea atroviridis TaxID=63577 RepID=UPI003329E604|nr:hypothetical protein TrAtP1_008577 [Trichoderma atroviride]